MGCNNSRQLREKITQGSRVYLPSAANTANKQALLQKLRATLRNSHCHSIKAGLVHRNFDLSGLFLSGRVVKSGGFESE
jgi:hypothetical protein